MRNKFGGWCYRCNKWVEKGQGHFERIPAGGGWRVQHAECAIKFKGTKHCVTHAFIQEENITDQWDREAGDNGWNLPE